MVYGSPNHSLLKNLWRDLNQKNMVLDEPWVIAGDFNSVTSVDEISNPDLMDQRRSWKERREGSQVILLAIAAQVRGRNLNHLFRFCTRAKSFWNFFAEEDFLKSAHIIPFSD